MKAKEYLFKWLDEKYGGSPELGDWTPEDVLEFAESYYNHRKTVNCKHENIKRSDGLDECLDCGQRNY